MDESVTRAINAMKRSEFSATFGSVFREAPWAAEEAYECRPFADISALKSTLMAMVRGAPQEARLRVLRAYPGLETLLAVASPRERIMSGTTLPPGWTSSHRKNSRSSGLSINPTMSGLICLSCSMLRAIRQRAS